MPQVPASQGKGKGSQTCWQQDGACGAADKRTSSVGGQKGQQGAGIGTAPCPWVLPARRQPGGRPATHRGALGLRAAGTG